MPRKNGSPRVPAPLKEGWPPYCDADFERMAATIGVPLSQVLARQAAFEEAALWYQLDMRSPRRVPPSTARAKLRMIAAAARKLLYHLDVRNPSEAPDGPGNVTIFDALASVDGQNEDEIASATARVGRLVEILEAKAAIEELERVAELAAKDVADLGDHIVPTEHRGDEAANDWLKAMMEIYKALTGNEPGASVTPIGPKRGDVGGPLIRFVQAAGRPIGIEYSAKAWRRRIRTAH